MRILVIDDSETVRKQLTLHFSRLGFQVQSAGDGASALETARGEQFDVIVLDFTMPDMDGLEVLRRLRSNGVDSAIVMLTGQESVDVAVKALKQGAQDYVSKPYNLETLAATVDRVFNERRTRAFMEAMERTLKSIGDAHDLERTLSALLTELLYGLDCRLVAVYLYDEHKQRLAAWGLTLGAAALDEFPPVDISNVRDMRVRAFLGKETLIADGAAAGIPEFPEPFDTTPVELSSLALTPLVSGGSAFGVIAAGRAPGSPSISKEDIALLQAFADQAGATLHSACRMDSFIKDQMEHKMELDMARDVQKSLLPRSFNGQGIRIEAFLQPAKTVGGDFYNFYSVDPNRVDFFIGDVVGKGIQASILMGHLMALMKEFRHESSPLKILTEVNHRLQENLQEENSMYVGTVFYGIFRSDTSTLRYATAGHPLPVMVRDGRIINDALDAGGTALGMLPELDAAENSRVVRPGDMLVLFTDGVTEAFSPDKKYYGTENLIRAVQENLILQPAEMVKYIYNDVIKFTGPGAENDDITIIIITFSETESRYDGVVRSKFIGIE